MNLRDICGSFTLPPEVERRIEQVLFTTRRYGEAVEAICQGRHALGCDGYTGEYMLCKCYRDIATAARSGDDVDFEDVKLPVEVPGGGREFYRLGDVSHLRCLQCRAPFTFDDWSKPVLCKCWENPRPRGYGEMHPWPPGHGIEYTIEEAQVVIQWKKHLKPEE